MVAVLAISDNAGMFVKGKGDLCLVGQAGALQDDLGTKLGHIFLYSFGKILLLLEILIAIVSSMGFVSLTVPSPESVT
jgi:hypothetical protein